MKTKNFLKMAFLLLALVGGVNSVWATDYYTAGSDEVIILNDVYNSSATTKGYSDHTAIWWGGTATFGDKTCGDPENNGAATSSTVKACSVKGNTGGKILDVNVKGITGIIVYHESHSSRYIQVKNGDAVVKNGSVSTYYTEVTGLNKNTEYSLRVKGTGSGTDNQDLFVYAIKLITPAPTEAPTITSNLASSADVYVGVAHDFSITATGATSYQWYKASSTTADIENDDAIDGATSSTYSYTAASTGTEYLYCAATNAIGSTLSTVCAVTATSATFHSVTYNLGDATGGTVPTQANVAEGNTFTVAAAPGDLVAPSGKEFKCWNDGTNDYNAGATYTMGDADVTLSAVYQDRTYKELTPTSTLDLSNAASTTFTTKWYTSNTKENCYYDALNGVVTFSPFAIYQSSGSQTWAKANSGNSTASTWDAIGVFKGSSYYFSSSEKSATMRNTERMYYYRVKNCTGVSVLVGGNAIIEAYQVTNDIVSADPVISNSINEAGTLSLTSLDKDKEYIIKVYGNNGNNNVVYNEIAFNFPKVTSVSGTITASGWNTFSCSYPLDLNTISGGTAYYAKEVSGGNVVLSPTTATVRAEEGLMIQGTANAEFTINVAASGSAISGNMMVGMPAGGEVAVAGSGYNYVFGWTDAAAPGFYKVTSDLPTLTAGKAYLHTTDALAEPEARLGIIFEESETGIDNVKREAISNNRFYNLNGQEIAQPTKGLYIVNGKKIVIK